RYSCQAPGGPRGSWQWTAFVLRRARGAGIPRGDVLRFLGVSVGRLPVALLGDLPLPPPGPRPPPPLRGVAPAKVEPQAGFPCADATTAVLVGQRERRLRQRAQPAASQRSPR